MAKHKKPDDAPPADPTPGLVELPQPLAFSEPPLNVNDAFAATSDADPAIPAPPDLSDVKVVHDLRVAGRLWRVREKAAGPAVLLVAGTKEEAEAAFRAGHPDAKTLKTEKLLP